MNLANDVQETGSEVQLSLTALNAAPWHPTATDVDEGSVVAKHAANSRSLDISGSQLLIAFLLALSFAALFVIGLVQLWILAQ